MPLPPVSLLLSQLGNSRASYLIPGLLNVVERKAQSGASHTSVCACITWILLRCSLSRSGWGMRTCISNQVPGDAHVTGPQTTL